MDPAQRRELENDPRLAGDELLEFLHANQLKLNRIEAMRSDYAVFAGLGDENKRRFGLTGDELLVLALHHGQQQSWFLAEARAFLARHGRLSKTAVLVLSSDTDIASHCTGAYRDLKSGYKSAFVGIPWCELKRRQTPAERQILLDEQFELQAFSVDHFDTRTPVPEDMFGRETLVAQVEHEVSSGQFGSALLGIRRVGKTSILKGVLENLRARSNEKWAVAMYDAQADTVDANAERALSSFVADLRSEGKRFDLALKPSQDDKRNAVRWLAEQLSAAGVRTVFAIDEIEWLVPTAINVGDMRTAKETDYVRLFGFLRALKQDLGAHVSLVVCGINETFCEVPEYSGMPNPALDLFRRQYAAMLGRTVSDAMTRTLAARMGIQVEDAFLDRLWAEFGGHPYLARQFCSELLRVAVPRPKLLNVALFDSEYENFLSNRADVVFGSVMTSLARFYPNEYEILRRLALEEPAEAPEASHLHAYGLISRDTTIRLGALRRYVAVRELASVSPTHFKRLARLGSGVTGTVWKCVDLRAGGNFCAVKVFTGDDAEEVAKLEWLALCAIKSEYVPRPIDLTEVDGQPAIQMELVDGVSLEHAIASGGIDFDQFEQLTMGLLIGLETIHPTRARRDQLRADFSKRTSISDTEYAEYLAALDGGFLHRDIKPANIIATRVGGKFVPKYVDLQLAKLADEALLTRVGTPAYAPADWGTVRWDATFDLYALGVVFFEMIFATRPPIDGFEAVLGSLGDTIEPDVFRKFFARALDAQAPMRYQSTEEMRVDWEDLITNPKFPGGPFPLMRAQRGAPSRTRR